MPKKKYIVALSSEEREKLESLTTIAVGKGNPAKAREQLGWQAQSKMNEVVRMMVEARSGTWNYRSATQPSL